MPGHGLALLQDGLARGDIAYSVALVVILSFASVISVPVLMGSQLFREQPAVMMGLLAYGLLWLSTALPASVWLRRFA